MVVSLNSNIAAEGALRYLSKNSAALGQSFERLSSGLRINRPSDDAAGLAIAAQLNTDAKVYSEAIRNANNAISLASTSESALEQFSDLLIRIRELATQAANGGLTFSQRKSMHDEAFSLTEEYNRILDSTEFNGIQPLVIDNTTTIQLGYGTQESLSFDLNQELERDVGDGTFGTGLIALGGAGVATGIDAGRLDGDSNLDVIVGVSGSSTADVYFGDGDGTFANASGQDVGGNTLRLKLADLDADGNLDIINLTAGAVYVVTGNGDGTFDTPVAYTSGTAGAGSAIDIGDVNGDGTLDILASSSTDQEINVFFGNGDGTFQDRITTSATTPNEVKLGDLNGDGKLDVVSTTGGTDNVEVYLGDGSGSFTLSETHNAGDLVRHLVVEDFDHDGYDDIAATGQTDNTLNILMNNGDGTFQSKVSYDTDGIPLAMTSGDLNGDGIPDLALGTVSFKSNVFLGNGDGTYQDAETASTIGPHGMGGIALGDINGDGALDLLHGLSAAVNLQTQQANLTETVRLQRMSLITQDEAREALAITEQSLTRVTNELANHGSIESRLRSALGHLEQVRENYIGAERRIMDVDFAEETAQLVRLETLRNASAAILSQANQTPTLALQLLEDA